MLRERVTELIDRYESGDEWLSAGDVMEELEGIMDEEGYDEVISPKLYDAIKDFVLQRHESERGGGRIPDGSDEFIEAIEEIIEYE